METKEMICINCPLGCPLTIIIDKDNITVTGNTCPRGEAYAKAEVTNPTRIVTSTIDVNNGERVSCKTEKAIPKDKIFNIMKKIKETKCSAPIKIGDVLIENVCDTGVNIIATKNIY